MKSLAGETPAASGMLRLPLLSPFARTPGKLELLAARLAAAPDGSSAVEILPAQGSASLHVLAMAEGWAMVPAAAHDIPAGALIGYCPADPAGT